MKDGGSNLTRLMHNVRSYTLYMCDLPDGMCRTLGEVQQHVNSP